MLCHVAPVATVELEDSQVDAAPGLEHSKGNAAAIGAEARRKDLDIIRK